MSDDVKHSNNVKHQPLEFTGERMVPESTGPETFWEHIYRYRFAAFYAPGKRVLDIACGEGYGTAALLRAGAASVVGIDVSEEACLHAQSKYGLDARVGTAEHIPLPNNSVDLIVSFETIEHVSAPDKFLGECLRVLASNGTLIISTPDKDIYSVVGEQHNPFHCSEMNEQELSDKLSSRFRKLQIFTQHPQAAPFWSARTFSAQRSSWAKVRGYLRAKKWLVSKLCPHILSAPSEAMREDVSRVTLAKDRLFSSWLNPYKVKRKSRWAKENATYVVAVARK